MMRSPTSTALAVRGPDGTILVDSKRNTRKKAWYKKVPVIRGVTAFFDSLVSGVKTLVKSAEVIAPEEEKPGKGWIGFAVFLGLALGIGLFFVLPFIINTFAVDRAIKETALSTGTRALVQSLIEGLIRIAIFILYLVLTGLMKDIRRTFAYHGAEHRTINCYEKDLPLTVENIQKCSTRHNRCGTTFLFFVMVIAILLFSLVNWLIALTPLEGAVSGAAMFFIKLGIRLGLLPLVAGLSYELLRGLAALPDNWFTLIFRAPGLGLQKLSTRKPDDAMAEVALCAFLEVQKLDENPEISQLTFGQFRYADVRAEIETTLAQTNADPAETDWIFCDVTGLKRAELKDIRIVTLKQYKKIKEILSRRKTGEPLWHILGYCDFYGTRLVVNRNALIPRFETELLCEQAIKEIQSLKANPVSVLDLCTGSGCIAAVLSNATQATITAADFSEPALTVAANNLENTNVKIVFSDMFDNLKGETYHVIVCNPPYIKSSDIDGLAEEVKSYEPHEALDGGADGLNFYRKIAQNAPAHLKKGGIVLLEVGFEQAEQVKKLLEKSFTDLSVINDLDGVARIVRARLKG